LPWTSFPGTKNLADWEFLTYEMHNFSAISKSSRINTYKSASK